MKKRGYIILISVVLIGVILGLARGFYNEYKKNEYKNNVIEKYGFEISYPTLYKDVSTSGDDESKVLSNVEVKESGEELSEYMASLKFVETVKNLKNEHSGMRLMIDAINTEKTSLSLEEICKRYVVMFRIYNEEKVVEESNYEFVNIAGYEAGKVTINIKGEKENDDSTLIAYLLSLDDKEITVTFIGSNQMIEKAKNEIEKIINSIKIY